MKRVTKIIFHSVFALVAISPLARGGEIKAGFAERDITPALGMEQTSSYYKVFHKAFHDACKVRVAVFDDGKSKVALVGVDALFVPREVVQQARSEIEKACGIKTSAIMIGASHSHSSGPVGVVKEGQFDAAPALTKRLAYEETSQAHPGYLLRMTQEIVRGVVAAHAVRVPARVGFGYGHEDQVSFNRRFRMKNGQTWTHPGVGNRDILDYAGPIDPQVGVVGVWNEAGELIGTVVNFACHATTSPGGISANWPYYLEQTIQGALQSRAPVVFLQGASGDITQVDNLSPYVRPSNEDWARLVGGSIGAKAVRVLLGMARGTDIPLDARHKTWMIKRRAPSPKRVAHALKTIEAGKPKGDTTDWVFAKETLMLDYLVSIEPATEVEVQSIQIGPLVCISNPAEYFAQYGLDIKQGSPFPFTFPVELANGCVGYVPTEEAFGPGGGGYETRLTFYSNLEVTAGRQFAETGIALARQMSPGPVPTRPRLPTTGVPSRYSLPSTYGNVPPELD